MRRLRQFRQVSAAMFAVIVMAGSALVLTGCGGDDDENGGGGGGDNKLVNGSGEAWVECDDQWKSELGRYVSGCDGYFEDYTYGRIFRSNGELMSISYFEDDAAWYGTNSPGKWSSDGNNITVNGRSFSYSVSGDTLMMLDSSRLYMVDGYLYGNVDKTVYTKRNDIAPLFIWGLDSKLFTGSNEAWIECNDEGCRGLILKSNGDCGMIYKSDGSWVLAVGITENGWKAVNGRINMHVWYLQDSGYISESSVERHYSVSGNTLTTVYRGWGEDIETVYTKTSGITYQ